MDYIYDQPGNIATTITGVVQSRQINLIDPDPSDDDGYQRTIINFNGVNSSVNSSGDPRNGGPLVLAQIVTDHAGNNADGRGRLSIGVQSAIGNMTGVFTAESDELWIGNNLAASTINVGYTGSTVKIAGLQFPEASVVDEGKTLTVNSSGEMIWDDVVYLKNATGRVDIGAATAPTAGQVLMATGATVATWQTPVKTFEASDLVNATGSNWAVDGVAAETADPDDNAINTRLFAQSPASGCGFTLRMPASLGSTINIELEYRGDGTNTGSAGFRLYTRKLAPNDPTGDWSASGGSFLTTLTILNNSNYSYIQISQSLSLYAASEPTAGITSQFELVRDGGTYIGAVYISRIHVSFT